MCRSLKYSLQTPANKMTVLPTPLFVNSAVLQCVAVCCGVLQCVAVNKAAICSTVMTGVWSTVILFVN